MSWHYAGRRNRGPEPPRKPRRNYGSSYLDMYLNSYWRHFDHRRYYYNEIIPKPVDVEADSSDIEPEIEKEIVKLIKVKSVDLNIPVNASEHHTSDYEFDKNPLVIRRGQPFTIIVEFDRPFNKETDDLKMVFEMMFKSKDGKPKETTGTRVSMNLSDVDLEKKWGAKIEKQDSNKLTIKVFTPPTCPVGDWSLMLEGFAPSSEGSGAVLSYLCPNSTYILFNPWCKDDQVFMHDDNMLKEYVLNDNGQIYVGSVKQIFPKAWAFGQFTKNVLVYVLKLLDKGKSPLNGRSRGDPVMVVRKLSALVNAQDDQGVLVGNWSGNYSGYTAPTEWTGSAPILKQYNNTNESVRYGQCWVFSGVLTTCLRALGLPARSVTNFESAHDTDGSMTRDFHYDEDGEPLEHENGGDSVWNFHVWNDVWMARPDLDEGYGGWQACDATPQELSEGVYQCGPSSLLAIKKGDVYLPYDTPFIFAEVNLDQYYWVRSKHTRKYTLVYRDPFPAGKFISTKKPLKKEREDVTNQYKFQEGSPEERASVTRALTHSTPKDESRYELSKQKEKDCDFKLLELDEIKYGQDYYVEVEVKNNASKDRNIAGALTLRSLYYTGVFAERVKQERVHLTMKPNDCKTLKMKVSFDEYDSKTVEYCFFEMAAMLQVYETEQVFCQNDKCRMSKPDLELKGPKLLKVGQKATFEVSFENPLPVTLTGITLHVEATGVQESMAVKGINTRLAPNGTFLASFDVFPEKVKENSEIVAVFYSRQLTDVRGEFDIEVRK